MSREDDRALRFYHEVLGLDHLHYGLWRDDDELTLANFRVAQERYEDLLVEKLPDSAEKILDVGCGTAAMTRRLLSRGLEVHGLSPDRTQRDNFTDTLRVPFYHCRFEDFESDERFDCLIMSESAQYIPFVPLFENARRHLNPGGHVMICDYFVLDEAEGVMAKSGHNLADFRAEATKRGFELVDERDITAEVSRTLDLGLLLAERVLKGLDIVTEKTRRKHPLLTRLVFRLFRKKWKKLERDRILLDSRAFRDQKRYLFMLYRAC